MVNSVARELEFEEAWRSQGFVSHIACVGRDISFSLT